MLKGLTVNLAAICVLFNLSTIKASTARLRSVKTKPGVGSWDVAWASSWAVSVECVTQLACTVRKLRE